MTSTSFVSRAPTFMSYAPYNNNNSYNNNSYNNSYNNSHMDVQYPSFHNTAAAHMPSPLALSVSASKLPSLEGLLKKMQTEHPNEPASPPTRSQQPQQLSPSGREMAPMPSLRAITRPSVEYVAGPSLSTSPFATRKRSWLNANATSAYPIKQQPRAVSPALSVRSSASSVSVSPHSPALSTRAAAPRSRASKYCKIDGCARVSQRNNLCHSHGGKRLCKEPECLSKDRGNGFCIKHGGGKICAIASCEKKARRKGLCTQHFRVCDDDVDESVETVGRSFDGRTSSNMAMDGMTALHYASTI